MQVGNRILISILALEKIGKDDEFLNYPLNVHTLPEPYMGTDHTISGLNEFAS